MVKNIRFKVSIILKLLVFISAFAGVLLSGLAGRNAFMGGRTMYMFFTIQSNIAIAVICLVGAIMMLLNCNIGRTMQIVKFVGTVSISLTGIVFCLVLAPTLGIHAWNIQNVLTHVVVPVVSVADFFVIGTCYSYKKKDVFWIIVPPLLYMIYAAIGYVNNWQFIEGYNYPYFFLNWGSPAGAFGFVKEFPFMGCVWWILILLLMILLVAYVYLKLLDLGKSRK